MKYKYKYNMLLQNDITSKNYFWLSNTRDDKQAIKYFIKCVKSKTQGMNSFKEAYGLLKELI